MREAVNLPGLALFCGTAMRTVAEILENMASRGEVDVMRTYGETADKERNTYYRLRRPRDGLYAWEQNLADARAVWNAFRIGSEQMT